MRPYHLHISCQTQILSVYIENKLLNTYFISTGIKGTGQQINSGRTPLGWHCVAEKFGDLAVENAVFIARKETGEVYSPKLKTQFPNRDWILTRILRLKGLETAFNLGGEVDTYERYIYIHGTPDEVILGEKGSKGCIRMNNKDIISIYNLLSIGTPVYISDR